MTVPCDSTYTLLSTYLFFFFNDTATTEIYTLSLHDALPISSRSRLWPARYGASARVLASAPQSGRSERVRLDLIATRARGCEHGERSRPRLHLAAASAK